MDQVERRLLNGESIAHQEKVFSVFEEHTRWISKGKAGVAVELGVPVCIVEDQFQFIVHHKILWQGGDVDVAVPMVEETQARFSDFRMCSFDRGFHSPNNRKRLDQMLDVNALPQKGYLSKADQCASRSPGGSRHAVNIRRSSRRLTILSIGVWNESAVMVPWL